MTDAIDRHKETLVALAVHGHTGLAADARALLELEGDVAEPEGVTE